MERALDALPGRPMSAEDIAALNNAATVRVIPYTWLGEQVIAALLLYDERRAEDDREVGADARVTETDPDEEEDDPFGGRDEGIGTVEVIGDEGGQSHQPASERVEDEEEDLRVYAVGYDDEAASWVVIAEIDPDSEFTDAEPPIREWAAETYHDAIVERLAIGPSEYELEE
ncbi:hypothetical protein GRX03_02375 [Halovenus sp. WSH3]|uniref:Uncharacterized protein n=1 Tax=Halovenus carboxidivorans TaxID=2692199 RepID=A0A6B0T564_9EURY|nr:hypothetical protein [Halovenus carboxidivorans]MXR50452.1 hypothetical protein [Halovenus carboxidivorans]